MDILLKLKDVREQMAQIATILFGLGLTANRRLEDKENPTIINLCYTLVELDSYYRELEFVCNRARLLPEAFSVIRLSEDVVSDLVTKATEMLNCVHDSKAGTISEGGPRCTLCSLRVRLIDVKLRRCTAQIRLRLQASRLRNYFAAEFPDVPLSSMAPRLYLPYSQMDNLNDLGTEYRLEKEATGIQDELSKAENQSKPPEAVGAVEVGGSPKTDPTAIELQPKPDVCEKCKSRTGLVGELEECHLRLAKATKELVQVFRAKKKFTKAAESYKQLSELAKKEMETHKLANAEEEAKKSEEEYLSCQYELAEMFRELKRNDGGLEIAKQAYQRRASLDRFGEEAKKSHYQYCSFLLLTNDIFTAKKEHREIYKELDDSGKDPARMIENGYQLVDVLERQGGAENAWFKCWQVFEKAQEIPDLEIKLLIKIAEKAVTLEESLKKPCEERIDEALKTVWGAVSKARTESSSSKLSDNHLVLCEKHGSRLLEAAERAERAEKAEYYEKAAQVLEIVWTDRKSHQSGLEERKASTLATAERLFSCFFDYGRFEDAARVGRWIVDARKKLSREDPQTIASQHSLGSAMVRAGGPGNLEGGKAHLKESWNARKDHLGNGHHLTLENGSDYGHVLAKLGETVNAKNVFTDVWTASLKKLRRQSDENEREILCSYGQQLASLLEKLLKESEEQSSTKILELVTRVCEELLPFMKINPPMPATNHLRMKLGKYLFEIGNHSEASKQLKEAWDEGNRAGANDSHSEDLCETGYYLFRVWMLERKSKIRKSNMKMAEPVIREVINLAEGNLGKRNAPSKYYKAKERTRGTRQRR